MSNITVGNEKNILFYSDEEGNTKVEVLLENEDVWLNVNAIATLFDVQRPAIVKHINNIYNDEELSRESTCSILEQVRMEATDECLAGYALGWDVGAFGPHLRS